MISEARILELRSRPKHRREFISLGDTDRLLRAQVEDRALRRVHHGWYLSAGEWNALSADEQHIVRAAAVHENARSSPVFSHSTAAILHGIPLYGRADPRVHVTTGLPTNRRSSSGVIRHRTMLSDEDVTEVGGLACTTLERTLLDVARSSSIESGLVCADAALRRLMAESSSGRDDLVDGLLDGLAAMPVARGGVKARRVLEIADPRAESPLESLSRLQLLRLGFDVDLQIPVPAPHGGHYFMDLELLGYETYAEVDGRVKYTDETMLGDRTVTEAVLDEKAREDWVRGRTRKRVVRWGWSESQTHFRLSRRLRAFGILPPDPVDRPRHLELFSAKQLRRERGGPIFTTGPDISR